MITDIEKFLHAVVEYSLLGTTICVAFAVYMAARHGLPWVWAKITSIWSSTEADWSQISSVLSTDLAAIEARFQNLEKATNTAPPAGTTPIGAAVAAHAAKVAAPVAAPAKAS